MDNSKENPRGHCMGHFCKNGEQCRLCTQSFRLPWPFPPGKCIFPVFFMTWLLSFSNVCLCFNNIKDGSRELKLQPVAIGKIPVTSDRRALRLLTHTVARWQHFCCETLTCPIWVFLQLFASCISSISHAPSNYLPFWEIVCFFLPSISIKFIEWLGISHCSLWGLKCWCWNNV